MNRTGEFQLWFRCVGTFHCSRSSSVSCRLQCLVLSFFKPQPTPLWKEEGCLFLWKAHLAGKETSIPTPPPTDLKPPINHHLCPHPLAHLLPVPPSQALEGWQGSVSGADDVTLGEVSEFRAVNRRNCLSLFTMPACQSCNSFCI